MNIHRGLKLKVKRLGQDMGTHKEIHLNGKEPTQDRHPQGASTQWNQARMIHEHTKGASAQW
jgi:hypothetical protein